jgi:hypothetical protein
MPFIENWQEFAERQQSEYLTINNRVLFANGAIWSIDGSFRADPPTDTNHLRSLRIEFLEERLRLEVEDFSRAKNEWLLAAHYAKNNFGVAPPPPDAKERLEAGKRTIEALQAEIRELGAGYAESPEGQAQLDRERLEQERLLQIGQLEKDILGVTVDAVTSHEQEQEFQRRLVSQAAAQQASMQFWSEVLHR